MFLSLICKSILLNLFLKFVAYAQTRIANILGVAGTDVPINEIKKLLSPFMVSTIPYEIDIFYL